MLTRMTKAAATGAAAALVVGLAGCTGAPEASGPDTSPSPVASEATLEPLSEYIYSDLDDFDARSLKSEEIAKKCMNAQGFDYTIVEVSDQPASQPPGTFRGYRPSREEIAQEPRAVAEHMVGERISAPDSGSSPTTPGEPDPQGDYVESLSPAQQEAYWAAYLGKKADAADPAEIPAKESGCSGKGLLAAWPNTDTPRPAILDDAQEFMNGLHARPEVTAITEEVTQCMTELGYSPDDPGATARKANEYITAHPSATADDPNVLNFADQVIKVMLANWDCEEKVHYVDRSDSVITDLQNDYIAEHKKELEEAKLWLNQ